MSEVNPDSEYEALMHMVERLGERFPAFDESELREMAAEEFEGFDNARVRDFVPVLVERNVVEKLRHPRAPVA